jgi:hypothetical protein
MTVVDGWFTCEAGGMQLSRWMEETLMERFPTVRPRAAAIVELGSRLERWFCPGCGIPLGREMTCGACGKSIHDLLFPLVELHPHSDV